MQDGAPEGKVNYMAFLSRFHAVSMEILSARGGQSGVQCVIERTERTGGK